MISALEQSADASSNGTQVPELSLIDYLRKQKIKIELLEQTLYQRELEIGNLHKLLLQIEAMLRQPDFNDQQRAAIIQLINDAISDS